MTFFRAFVLFAVVSFTALRSGVADEPIVVGEYFIRSEGTFTATTPTYVVPLTLPANRRLVVEVAAQFASDFGIIPAADLKKWIRRENPAYLVRLTGETNTRYVTINAGEYYVVARDISGAANNGFAVKIRRFTSKAIDDGVRRTFLSNQVSNAIVPAFSWNGFAFSASATSQMWFEGVFSRGLDRKVRWEIVTASEYQKFLAGSNYQVLQSGSKPKKLGF
jgi:hypothetical protein